MMEYCFIFIIFIMMFVSFNICVLNPLKILLLNKSKKEEVLYANELFKMIDARIEDEVINNVKFYIMAGEKYKVLNFDDDITKIATAVNESLSTHIITSCPLYKSDYIMKYIIRKTSNILFTYIQSEYEA